MKMEKLSPAKFYIRTVYGKNVKFYFISFIIPDIKKIVHAV